MIPRLIEKIVFKRLNAFEKIILLLGARQTGKTTLLDSLRKKLALQKKEVLYLNCDLDEDRQAVNSQSLTILKKLIAKVDYLLIDEVQRLDNPGLTLKIVHDHFPRVKVLATGSSSFDLKNKLSDALTGRYLDFILYPLSFLEVLNFAGVSNNPVLRKKQADAILDETLLFGLYPEIYLQKKPADKKLFLEKIVESYLFRDILAFQKVRHPQVIKDLAAALAYQIGCQVNENELANRLKIDRKTVVNYLDILEKSFVILRLRPFSQNPRREIGRSYKVYFIDLGVRNMLIGDFNNFRLRQDAGVLWENFLILERIKSYINQGQSLEYHFWRSYAGAEVDYLERVRTTKKMQAFEIKYRHQSLSRGSQAFSQKYQLPVQLVNKENYLDFISVS